MYVKCISAQKRRRERERKLKRKLPLVGISFLLASLYIFVINPFTRISGWPSDGTSLPHRLCTLFHPNQHLFHCTNCLDWILDCRSHLQLSLDLHAFLLFCVEFGFDTHVNHAHQCALANTISMNIIVYM